MNTVLDVRNRNGLLRVSVTSLLPLFALQNVAPIEARNSFAYSIMAHSMTPNRRLKESMGRRTSGTVSFAGKDLENRRMR